MENKTNECGIVKDILPLYCEGLTGADSVRFVESHIKFCEECRSKLEQMKKNADIDVSDTPIETVPLKKMRRMIKRRRNLAVSFTALVLCSIFIGLFSYLTNPRYLPYSEEIVSVNETEDGSVILSFGEEATDFAVYRYTFDDGKTQYRTEAWYTVYDRLVNDRFEKLTGVEANAVTITSDNRDVPTIYYVQNNGKDDVFLCGEKINGGGRTLPRLVLGYYLFTAAGCLAVSVLLYALFRKREKAKAIIGKIVPLPLSYMIAHFLIKGNETLSYSAGRDFCMILITAAIIYSAILIGLSLIKMKGK